MVAREEKREENLQVQQAVVAREKRLQEHWERRAAEKQGEVAAGQGGKGPAGKEGREEKVLQKACSQGETL